ncbi:hypothetical protein SBBP2_190042 [Burkholderiales bacterium]|nr:hypothetical protein SBBP2_190042 [Burkholderiales bacterium]
MIFIKSTERSASTIATVPKLVGVPVGSGAGFVSRLGRAIVLVVRGGCRAAIGDYGADAKRCVSRRFCASEIPKEPSHEETQ